jgi:outer membrane PBP1 activator LpoA protein
MYSPMTRLVLILTGLALGSWMILSGQAIGAPFLVAAAMLIWGHFRYGTVWLAWRAAKRGDLAKAHELLGKIRSPDKLTPQSRAYYHWLTGCIAAENDQPALAQRNLGLAASGRLRTENDRSIVLCQMARICLDQGEPDAARGHLAAARAIVQKDAVSQMIEEIQARLEKEV